MDIIKLGRTGLEVSRICLGCMSYGEPDRGGHPWTLSEEESRPFIRKALELGINFFDTANVYSDGTSEEIVGRALQDFAPRDEVVIATKVHGRMRPGPNGAACRARRSWPRSTPACGGSAPTTSTSTRSTAGTTATPIEETLEALHDVVKAGKARYIGASSMYAWQFAKALHAAERHGWTRFVSMQNHFNLLYREEEREMLPLCRDRGHRRHPVEPAGARPAHPRLGRRRARARRPTSSARRSTPRPPTPTARWSRRVAEVAAARGVPRAQVALAWLLAEARRHRADRRRDQARSTSTTRSPRCRLTLVAEEIAALEAPYVPHAVVGFS